MKKQRKKISPVRKKSKKKPKIVSYSDIERKRFEDGRDNTPLKLDSFSDEAIREMFQVHREMERPDITDEQIETIVRTRKIPDELTKKPT